MESIVKTLRTEKGYTQQELADMIGISLRAYQYIERGERKPNINAAMKIAKLFNRQAEEIFTTEL